MENSDYFEITSHLDPREVLRYLNNLGIHNINGEVLKYFITDLKKLIKYDLMHKNDNLKTKNLENNPGLERLHSASTLSSRLKSKNIKEPIVCNREYQKDLKLHPVRNIRSAPNLVEHKLHIKLPRRACSCIQVEKKTCLETPRDTHKSSGTLFNNNLIKLPKQKSKKKCDPVSLYHYYISQWAKYKPNVPGENDWAELRWNIRQKMVGSSTRVTN